MRSRTSKWFECSVRYDKTQEDGTQKKVTEKHVVDALSFTEAEARLLEDMKPYISGDFEVTAIAIAPYREIFFMGGADKILANETDKMTKALQKHDHEMAIKPVDLNPNNADVRWYKAKLQFITIDEKTERERHSNVTYLVEGTSLSNANSNIIEVMSGTMIDYVSVALVETPILDVFEHVTGK